MRVPNLTPDEMTEEQKQVFREIEEGPRSTVPGRSSGGEGPFNLLIRRPKLADRVQKLGLYIRFDTCLEPRIVEFAVMIAARHWNAQYVWVAHRRHAIRVGLDPRIADELSEGKRPAEMKADEEMTYRFCTELFGKTVVGAETYAAATRMFGIDGVLDLMATYGYYSMIGMFLNVNESKPTDGPLMVISER